MDYDALVAQVIELLQREKRVPYRVLKRRFDLDDDYIEDLKMDLIEAKRLAIDEHDRILVWIGDAQAVTSQSTQPTQLLATQEQPAPLVEPRPTASPPDAERRQLTVMFFVTWSIPPNSPPNSTQKSTGKSSVPINWLVLKSSSATMGISLNCSVTVCSCISVTPKPMKTVLNVRYVLG